MDRYAFVRIKKFNTANISIPPKLFYRVNGIPVKIPKAFLWNMES